MRSVQIANDRHVTKDVRVASVIKLHPVFEFDHVTASLPAIDKLAIIENAAGVVRVHHRDFNIIKLLSATFIHFCQLLHAFFAQPSAQLRNTDDFGIVPFCNLDSITDVIPMAMRHHHYVNSLDVLFTIWAGRVSHHPRIDKYDPRAPTTTTKSSKRRADRTDEKT